MFQAIHLSQDRDDSDSDLVAVFSFLLRRIDIAPMRYSISPLEQLVLKVPGRECFVGIWQSQECVRSHDIVAHDELIECLPGELP